MSEEQLTAFLEAVRADAGLQEKLNAASDADAVVEIAKAAGFVISAEELQMAQVELSDEELESVAGGRDYYMSRGNLNWAGFCTEKDQSPAAAAAIRNRS